MNFPSRTALGVALLRAAHRTVDREPWILDDAVSTAVFAGAARRANERDAAWADGVRAALRAHLLVRSAFAEERMLAGVARGVDQVVLLGAGFETLAYRLPPALASVRLFEVDAPATQDRKRALFADAGYTAPPNVTFLPIDFERTALADALAAAGFDRARPAMFSWLGVMMYLSRDAVDGILRYVGALAPGTQMAFTFSTPDSSSHVARRVAELGEPIRTRVTLDELATMVREAGFSALEIVSPAQAQRFLGERSDALVLPPYPSMALASV